MGWRDRLETVVDITVEGMSCASCVGRVEKAIRAVPGVAGANVNLATSRASVELETSASASEVVSAIETAGYQVPRETIVLALEGMSCASCVGRVEKALLAVPGVISAAVNLATERAHVEVAMGAVDAQTLEQAVAAAGYGARAISETGAPEIEDRREHEAQSLRNAAILAGVLTLPLFVLEMGSHFMPAVHMFIMNTIGMQTNAYLQFVLASVVLFGPGRRFLVTGFPNLLRGAPDMNALVALGTSAAWGYSTVATFLPGVLPAGTVNVYFEAAAVIITLVLVGRYLEARAKGRASLAIKHLIGLQPRTARVRLDGAVHEVDIARVRPGDVIEIRPGERLPVDGVVIEGSSFVDESMITGEPMPVEKSRDATVTGGTINTTGALAFRATRTGRDTVLARIIAMVEAAQGAKLPIQALVDRVTGVFVPIVIAMAILTFGVWLVFGPSPQLSFALVNAVAVLIIACPCAMGLATPTSIMVGTGRGAVLGVLFRKGEALQALQKVDVVAFDKTGTLTEGQPKVTDFVVAEGFDAAQVLALVASVEQASEHPIASAIVRKAGEQGAVLTPVSGFAALPGLGVTGQVEGRKIAIGADRAMAGAGVDISAFAAQARALAEGGKTPLYAAIDGHLAALIAVADPIKPSARLMIERLHDMGLEVAMITGDNSGTANAVAREIGIDTVMAEVLPAGKVEAVEQLRQGGRKVAFVGDGINDAPALAAADVGIAVGTGTDVAIESAEVVLMSADLRAVADAIGLSHATMRNIRQNLFWAFAYNATLIPVAAGVLFPLNGVLLSPVLAAGAMALSSVFVVGNALRLNGFGRGGQRA